MSYARLIVQGIPGLGELTSEPVLVSEGSREEKFNELWEGIQDQDSFLIRAFPFAFASMWKDPEGRKFLESKLEGNG